MSDLVTVVVPARNEEANLGPCLSSILNQDWRNLQLLVVDGASTDGTRAVVQGFAGRDPRVELLVNPQGTIPGSLNLALRAARGSWFIRVDAHASVPPDYVRRLVHHLESGDWGGVGGRKDGQGITPAGRAIAAAMASPFGVGNSTYHHGRCVRTVDHIPFGAYPTALARELGGWDERLLANEDYEFDYRVRRQGRQLLFDPELKIGWQCRQAVPELFHQYRRYGRGKADVARLHPASLQPRHVVAPGLLGSWLGALLLLPVVRMLAALPFAVYLLGLAFATAHTSRGLDRRARPYLPAAFLAMHVGWGLGFWEGLARRRVAHQSPSASLGAQGSKSPSPSGGGQGGGLARAAVHGAGGDRDPGAPARSVRVRRGRPRARLHHVCRRRDRPRAGPGARLLSAGPAPQRRRPAGLPRRFGGVRRGGDAGGPAGGVFLRSPRWRCWRPRWWRLSSVTPR